MGTHLRATAAQELNSPSLTLDCGARQLPAERAVETFAGGDPAWNTATTAPYGSEGTDKCPRKNDAIRGVPGIGDNDQSIHPPVRGGTTRSLGTRQTIRGAPWGRRITERQMSICAAAPTSVVGPASPGCRPTIDVGGVPGDLRCRAARARAAKIPAAFKLPVRLRTPCIPAGFVRMQ